jgi:hypothetical protein
MEKTIGEIILEKSKIKSLRFIHMSFISFILSLWFPFFLYIGFGFLIFIGVVKILYRSRVKRRSLWWMKTPEEL